MQLRRITTFASIFIGFTAVHAKLNQYATQEDCDNDVNNLNNSEGASEFEADATVVFTDVDLSPGTRSPSGSCDPIPRFDGPDISEIVFDKGLCQPIAEASNPDWQEANCFTNLDFPSQG
jgi:hypothetical protein